MTDRPRPHDHLVEPMYTALVEEPANPPPRSPRGLWTALLLVGALGIAALIVFVLTAE